MTQQADDRLAVMIAARMRAESASDVSDAEILRTLSGCCAPRRLIAKAHELRASGRLFFDQTVQSA